MATDMDVTTATFGTAALLLASGDPITDDTGSAWGGQVAQNTGWLYYQPRTVFNASFTFSSLSEVWGYGTAQASVYLPAGTYSVYGAAAVTPDEGLTDQYGSLSWDGTALVATEDALTTGSLCGWSVGTAGWGTCKLIGGIYDQGNERVAWGGIAIRFGSYAP